MRAAILADKPSDELVRRLSQFRMRITTSWDRMFIMGDPPDYEPEASKSIAAMAQRSNHTPDEVAYDYLAGGLDKFLFFPIVGYNEDNHDVIRSPGGNSGISRAKSAWDWLNWASSLANAYRSFPTPGRNGSMRT